MDNPNAKAPQRLRRHNTASAAAAVNLRRHKSLPGPLRSIRPQRRKTVMVQKHQHHSGNNINVLHRLNNSKSNPYVGWFRHAPPLNDVVVGGDHSNSSNMHVICCWLDASTVLHKKRRYVAKGHHLQYDEERIKTLLQIKQALKELNNSNSNTAHDAILSLSDLLKKRGYLRGGGKDSSSDLESFLQEQCAGSESITVKALSRIACWFLDVPPLESPDAAHSSEKHLDQASIISDDEDDDEDDNDENTEYDNYDTFAGSRYQHSGSEGGDDNDPTVPTEGCPCDIKSNNSSSNNNSGHLERSSMILSSQAEAYYALSAVCSQLLLQQEQESSTMYYHRHRSGSLDETSRLDYDITQMDIVRMNRIASRHLDVESIVRLPVLTYESGRDPAQTGPALQEDEEQHRSCCEEQDSRDAQETSESASAEEKNDTEFSWMLVPPPQATRSFDDSMEHRSATITTTTSHCPHPREAPPPKPPTPPLDQQQQQRDFCVICLEHFVQGDRLRVLPCTHSFHVGCIDRWLSGSHSFDDCYTSGCPTCKKRPSDVVNVHQQQQHQQQLIHQQSEENGSSVPSWAFARIGDVLARESRHF